MDMDVYFGVDDLLDLSNDDIFTSSISTTTTTTTTAISTGATINITTTADSYSHYNHFSFSDNFNHDICVPNDEIAELEWLSNFVDDSFSELTPAYSINAGTMNVRSCSQFNGCSRSTKSTANPNNDNTISNIKESTPLTSSSRITSRNGDRERLSASSTEMLPRKCTHCSSEKTPQWRAGPSGPKTLCNACGVRYKSGRLVPEYRPASSPTFVLTQHSNSHRKVLELRRQKELLFGQQQQGQEEEEQQQQQQEALYRTYTTSQAC